MEQELLDGRLVTWEESREIIKMHPEWRVYLRNDPKYPGATCEDFYVTYKRAFPGAYPQPRIRLSDKVNELLMVSRPVAATIAWDEALKVLQTDPALELFQFRNLLNIGLVGIRQKHMGGQLPSDGQRPSICYVPGLEIFVYFIAEIDIARGCLLFHSSLERWAEKHYVSGIELLERQVAAAFGLDNQEVPFPEPIREEHLVSYGSYPDLGQLDDSGRPLQLITAHPLLRVSYWSEPAAAGELVRDKS